MEAVREYFPHIDTSGHRPVIAGTRIKVSMIARLTEQEGMRPAELVEAYPHLTLADIHAALTYYYDHRDAIHLEWEEGDVLIAEMKAVYPSRLKFPT